MKWLRQAAYCYWIRARANKYLWLRDRERINANTMKLYANNNFISQHISFFLSIWWLLSSFSCAVFGSVTFFLFFHNLFGKCEKIQSNIPIAVGLSGHILLAICSHRVSSHWCDTVFDLRRQKNPNKKVSDINPYRKIRTNDNIRNENDGKKEKKGTKRNGMERFESGQTRDSRVPRHKYCSIGIRHSNNGFVCTKNYKNWQIIFFSSQ